VERATWLKIPWDGSIVSRNFGMAARVACTVCRKDVSGGFSISAPLLFTLLYNSFAVVGLGAGCVKGISSATSSLSPLFSHRTNLLGFPLLVGVFM
jgi:hypothetical protein